ncbi:VWA domain-containing protein [Tepidibacillus fermentans]|uniref:Ca-activated chloride channel family protein n=1 Tax=Tepidibacillus fermentans TaxID=1281767 RepID=A0A4R3KB36_9BACI|nr:VWA domain-containing protein [Tepidibacillus fermentans]TCS80150.1 Ca-activated chloride channel family protein [Tepidibacillus fermentans]
MRKQLTFQQIILITDGYSNSGISPIEAAKIAYKDGVIIHVIGITDDQKTGVQGITEIEAIAKAGGGYSQIVQVEQVAKTIELFTKKTMNYTIQQVINQQLMQILQHRSYDSLPPNERIEVGKIIDQLSEYSHLKILLLVDRSASMSRKMEKLKEAIYDFQLSIHSRAGDSQIAIAFFPGIENIVDIVLPWTTEISKINPIISKLIPNGNTPTGPALLTSLEYMLPFMKNIDQRQRGVLDEFII